MADGEGFILTLTCADHPGIGHAVSGFQVPIAAAHGMTWELPDAAERPHLLILLSRFGQCLNDLLCSRRAGAVRVDIPVVVSNHADFAGLAESLALARAVRRHVERRVLLDGARTVVFR